MGHRMKEIWNNDRNEDAQQYENKFIVDIIINNLF